MITHLTSYDFPNGANRLSLILRLWPEPYAGLTVRDWQVTVGSAIIKPSARTGYGERSALWSGPAEPGHTAITARGTVEVEDRAGVISGLTRRIEPGIFLRTTRRTKADKAVRDLGSGGPPQGGDQLAWLHQLMTDITDRVAYVTGSTTIETAAAESLVLGKGVCQDHAHIFIAAARAHGIPARYVCGYLLAAEDALALHETHAWAEAWIAGLGWVGFDPSNGLCPTERYVRLCVGLDAVDAAPIRGHASGGQALGLYADVRISPQAMPPGGAPPTGSAPRGSAQGQGGDRQWQAGMQQQ